MALVQLGGISFHIRSVTLTESFKIVIPMAGWGTRMRPHTWSKPKPLVSVAGKTALEHVLDMFQTLPHLPQAEFIFIVGPYLGEQQVPPLIQQTYPWMQARFVVQHEMKGQSHALWLAREHLHGPMVMCFGDTLIETDFSFLAAESADGVAWVKRVPDPRRFGVAEVDDTGWVRRFIEKPQTVENNLAVVGCYYFREAESLMAAIEEQMRRGITLKGEYFLTDAISLMIEHGARIRLHQVDLWLDTGTIETTLEANRILLTRHLPRPEGRFEGQVQVRPPSFVHPTAILRNAVIGPYASIGPGCRIEDSHIEESILEAECDVKGVHLTRSVVGRRTQIHGTAATSCMSLNIGDDSSVVLL